MKKTLILGIGNVLLGDEGAGVHAIKYLNGLSLPGNVDLLDGGTGGFHLLSLFRDYTRIIIIDAALNDDLPGTVNLLKPRYASDFPRTLSAHDIGLKDLVESASLLGELPELYLITVSIHPEQPLSLELSGAIETALVEVGMMVAALIQVEN